MPASAAAKSAAYRLDETEVSSYFGCQTFNDSVMRAKLPKDVYDAFRQTLLKGEALSQDTARIIAHGMKEWAMEMGATHYSHWFLPMTGATAEKHDAFITWDGPGVLIERFSGSQLAKGESDASSFPSGGLRATFEARGYTMWDASSPAFIMEGPLGKTLCIPTAFVGYHGEALDHKVPLLRSMEVLNQKALQSLALMGHKAERVTAQCGAEQEYFLVDLELGRKRPDLLFANRTLQGARPPKGQEMEDHYFGSIKPRVLAFMQEVEALCFRLGIPAKTRHNEVAPNQFEFAPLYEPANLASDHNQLLMELLKSLGERHGLMVLLHEKPFAGVNGSGKHVNWSMATESGINLLEPGKTPEQNLQFLFFLTACLKAIHRHGALLRAAIASAGNDHRLGANEAPPAIMSAFLGEQLSAILDAIDRGDVADASERRILDLGLAHLPCMEKDATDRNRTSPFAFTGNKFEFRAVGSSQPIAFPMTVIQAAVAQALEEMNALLAFEKTEKGSLNDAILAVVRHGIAETRAIRFEGNGYSDDWREEADRRGLPHARNTVGALALMQEGDARQLFKDLGIMQEEEWAARIHIRHEQYQKTLSIEAQLLREMTETMILPGVMRDLNERASTLVHLEKAGIAVPEALKQSLANQTHGAGQIQESLWRLKTEMIKAEADFALEEKTRYYGECVKGAMDHLRGLLDQAEKDCDARQWPMPVYRELLSPL